MRKILLNAISWLNNHRGEITVMLFIIVAVLSLLGINLSWAEFSDITGYRL